MACGASVACESGVRGATLREDRHSKRDESDCGPEHHDCILRRFLLTGKCAVTSGGRRGKYHSQVLSPSFASPSAMWAAQSISAPSRSMRPLR